MVAFTLKGNKRCPFSLFWWVLTGSNRRPSVRQTDALPAELNTQIAGTVSIKQHDYYTYLLFLVKVFVKQSMKVFNSDAKILLNMKITNYIESLDSFENKKIVLLGGTSGIGLCLLNHLVYKHAQVILLALEDDVANKLKEEYSLLDVIHYDQSSFESIDSAINELLKKHEDFDTIVMNVGVLNQTRILDNGYPATIGINYIGARYFIDNISRKLSQNVKFVIAGSFAAMLSFNKKLDLKSTKRNALKQYNASKAYLEAYFYKLSTEKPYPNIEYVLAEPGLTNTAIINGFNKVVRFLGKYFLKWFFHSPNKASLGLLLGISSKSKNGDFITPRGIFHLSGYPKIRKLPSNRRKVYLFK